MSDDFEDLYCVCGHTAADHHMSWLWGHPDPWIEECEYFGSNETGGAEFVDGKWIDHCNRFRLVTNE